ncbi:MAG: alkyl hydroperoxide reductase subunit F [Pseudomonadales bacterium]|nr:alkyl hydroperoxide reductase subunit F [Pseudomonadales bacterium]MBO6563120.1 alkyl hydroperoxide reductase subunit F [Pseudomonadales bacterium]MBO6596932.1 alkyl hydroperoxide reductase subunit F [Pseudomonadales bacterium]MBO6823079.1 alkyl hydroperoxide reductase subunit F [Pseudomonadales bacterium]
MLTQDILDTLKSYTEGLTAPVKFVLQSGDHEKRDELRTFLGDVCSVSDLLSLEEADLGLRSPISFKLYADNNDTGIGFSGIPSGHEFNSLILAMLQSAGTPIKMDDGLQAMIRNVKEQLHFEVFVSLSCHNCPDVVQALNQFALLNDKISAEMIDGGLFQDIIKDRDIQGVPSVYANGELFANGKIDAAKLIDLLVERDPAIKNVEPSESMPLQDVVVVGGGPAGVSSAIYTARKGLKVTLIADRLGGQVKDTMGIENFISVPKTTGTEMTGDLARHMADYEITVKENLRVEHIEKGNVKTLKLSSGETITTRALIIATGAQWRELGIPGEKENIGNGVAYCPHCDGPFFKGKDVAVIGGGNSGIEAALDLSGIVRSVTVFEFLPELKADQVLVDQAQARGNIEIFKNVATQEITATSGKVDGISFEDRGSGEKHHRELDAVFVQIGLVPNSAFVQDLIELTPWGEIVIDEKCQTSEAGIYACGDVTTVPYKQIVISMGEGAKASLAAFEYLMTHEVESADTLAA